MEQNIAVLGTHQINRDGNAKIGDLANLALADAIGQDADIILRAVTGKIEGADVSALVVLGGRELPIDGIIINSVPCIDFTEKSAITDKKQVLALMDQETKEIEKEDRETQKRAAGAKKLEAAGNKVFGAFSNPALPEAEAPVAVKAAAAPLKKAKKDPGVSRLQKAAKKAAK